MSLTEITLTGPKLILLIWCFVLLSLLLGVHLPEWLRRQGGPPRD